MADLIFTAKDAKDTENLATDRATAKTHGVTLDEKKGNVIVAADSKLETGSLIDVSGSAYFKNVSVASDYEGAVDIEGNGTIANTFYAGGGGSTMFGGNGELNDKDKLVTGADKIYGGTGADVFVYAPNAGKDTFYNYQTINEDAESEEEVVGANDVIQVSLGEGQSMSFVDKNGGLTITISDPNNADVAKNSVLTIDGKSASAAGGFILTDGTNETVYGVLPDEVGYGLKSGKTDSSTLTLGGGASGDVNVNLISSNVKNISAANEGAVYITGNGNANAITIGSGGGTIDGGFGAKATADKIFGTSSGAVTYVFDGVNGGKDTFGDAKLTQYNYKKGDSIVLTNATFNETMLAEKSGDVVLTIDKNNVLTLKNAVGKPINIYSGEVGTNGSITVDETLVENWGNTLPAGLAYDAKISKISADAVAIESLPKVGTRTQKIELGTYTLPSGETVTSYYDLEIPAYEAIKLGGNGDDIEHASLAASVKEIDMSVSEAPVVIDVSDPEYANVNVIKAGVADSTIVGNVASSAVDKDNNPVIVNQTFTAGNGVDLFQINAAAKLEATVVKNNKKAYKADVINGIGAGDSISIDAAVADITFVEKGKDLNIELPDEATGATYTVITVKNFDSDTALTLIGSDGKKTAPTPMPTGLAYASKNNKLDKTGLVASGALAANVVKAADYGDTTIKNIDATGVTSATGNQLLIEGGSIANNIYAPSASIATTLNGGAGNDNLTGGAGKTTFVFQAQDKGKKDVITGFKSGDVIMIDQSTQTLYAAAEFDSDNGDIIYDKDGKGTTASGGFNDSKADVVLTINKGNTITVKEAAGKPITLVDGDGNALGTFGHVLPTGLAYDSKNTTVSLSGGSYKGDVILSDTTVYYSTIKKVDLSGNKSVANAYGNTLANELIAGTKGGILDGGSVYGLTDAKDNALKPTADKLTGGAGKDTYVYDVGYGKDSFLSFGEGDVVSLGADITAANLSIVDKKNVLNVSILDPDGNLFEDPKDDDTKGSPMTAANSTFTITKTSDNVAVTFVGTGIGSYVYGSMPSGASIDEKYSTISVSTDAAATVDASVINSQPKTIDARTSTADSSLVLVGNANADAIYGGAGSNTLFGGTAGTKAVKDVLYGGAGKDHFVFTTQGGLKGKESDVINNYVAGDVIVLDREPDLVKADGKKITLTFNDEVTGANNKVSTVASTLEITGAATDSTMKKFGNIDSDVAVTFAIGSIYNEDTGAFDLSGATETYVYNFDPTATASVVQKNGDSKDVALKAGIPWDQLEEALGTGEEESSEQYAATDGWFEEIVSTDNASVSELDSILDAKGALNGDLAQLDGDAFFTNTSFESKAAAITGARHQAKK